MTNREQVLADLVREILNWTRHKNTDWAKRAEEALATEAPEIMAYQLVKYLDIIDVRLERCRQYEGPDLWAIRERGNVLNKDAGWEYEPIPSSRNNEFFERTRFASADEAFDFWRQNNCKSLYEHLRERYAVKEKPAEKPCQVCGKPWSKHSHNAVGHEVCH